MEENHFDNPSFKDGFAGDRRYFKGFLAKTELEFLLYQERFLDDGTKVLYVISKFYGSAMNCAASFLENHDP